MIFINVSSSSGLYMIMSSVKAPFILFVLFRRWCWCGYGDGGAALPFSVTFFERCFITRTVPQYQYIRIQYHPFPKCRPNLI